MEKLKYIFLLFIGLINAQETITLEQCYQWSRENYPLIKKQELIKKAEQFTTENALKGWLPQVNITAQATYQNDVTQFPVKLPNVNVEPLSKDQYKVFADVSQTIYDGGNIRNQKNLAKIQSEVQTIQTEVELDKLKERINQLYFGILQTNKQWTQLQFTKLDIKEGIKKAEAQLKNGVIFRSNLDVLKAELVKIEQKEIELQAIKQNFVQMLSYFIKKNIDENTQLETPEKILLTNNNNRSELKLFDSQKQLLETQRKIINTKNTPKLGAFFQGGYGKPGFNMLKNEFDIFYIGGIRLNIPISGFYTQKNDLALLENQSQEIEIQRENFLFNQNFIEIQQRNDLEKIQNLIDKDNELIELRKNIKTASLAQLENGVINTNDYLREVTAEEQAILTKITHEIQYLLTQYNLKAQLNN
ncbi:TolC family protein [Cloacibacterium normanense]|uniref:Outer membrane efflux family protein n=1 Tax=Cloacibacterium normanense TaxID=237258 RepID=A0A1E5UGZ8_9FLAO|nr:TolC family protein [Cloacibacterium normanense]AZI68611.1 TolC family protein [Cloacibacterium normanense]OEL12088.1 outer membrane efflux family protein [Cloacibacterium normanense]SDO42761.1 Outer membrane protein TolC [Cloacibacterium normanense]